MPRKCPLTYEIGEHITTRPVTNHNLYGVRPVRTSIATREIYCIYYQTQIIPNYHGHRLTVTLGQRWSRESRMENTFLVFSILLGMRHGVSAPTPRRNVHRTVRMRHGARSGQRIFFGRRTVLQIVHRTGPKFLRRTPNYSSF